MSEAHEVFVPITAFAPEWREGYDAERVGRRMSSCPHLHAPRAKLWREGWTASSRQAPARYRRDEPAVVRTAPPASLPPLAQAYQDGFDSILCPGCEGEKARLTLFCDRCDAALPAGWWLVHWQLHGNARVRYWQTACADLRGE